MPTPPNRASNSEFTCARLKALEYRRMAADLEKGIALIDELLLSDPREDLAALQKSVMEMTDQYNRAADSLEETARRASDIL